eukprot:TRINITY_DN63401_c0_g1_i1.p1 TRINITY_DN63401_c0_g1~~TRINITY_DN63401_c0_g1_i1.p1  ORF type:complete len:1195 (-),score=296.00 TRINITY_DN63401_c0_g1_i1:27-3611(-)
MMPRSFLSVASALILGVVADAAGSQTSRKTLLREHVNAEGSASEGRVIFRFSDAIFNNPEAMANKLNQLQRKEGVVDVKVLSKLGMGVLYCDSQNSEELVLAGLSRDLEVDLAVPDTWVQAFGTSTAAPQRLEETFAPPQVAFQHTSNNLFLAAKAHGNVTCDRKEAPDTSYSLIYNKDGTYSFKAESGNYLSAQDSGRIVADRSVIGHGEKFSIQYNNDGTICLETYDGKFVVADVNGTVRSSKVENPDESSLGNVKFFMVIQYGPQQRFANDPFMAKLWGMHNYYGNDIQAVEAWNLFTGEPVSDVIVGVIDTGIDYNHDDLKEQMWVNTGEIPGNGIDDDGNGWIDDVHGINLVKHDGDPMDDQMHGTHCAGTIGGAGNNGIGVAGVAWQGVRLMALKFLNHKGGGRTSDAITAVDYAVAHGAKILSNSWGGGGSSPVMRFAIQRAKEAGVLFVAAAGNSASDNDENPQYPANYGVENVISVASIAPDGKLSDFSCFGKDTVTLAAPGSYIYSTAPGNKYQALSGTSMACPHVSGVAALIWSYRPQLSLEQVKDILVSTVDVTEKYQNQVSTNGRVNAFRALLLAGQQEAPKPPANVPKGIEFKDTNSGIGALSGAITITCAEDESDIDYYRVVFVSSAGFIQGSLGTVNATGAQTATVNLNSSVGLPKYSKKLMVVAGNASGEQSTLKGFDLPSIPLDDDGIPEVGARRVSWKGKKAKQGFVAGEVVVLRAMDERTITRYDVYWSNSSYPEDGFEAKRGPLLGSLPAMNFKGSSCKGKCELLNVSSTMNGVKYSRKDYDSREKVQLTVLGPAVVTVTYFDTEAQFDSLTVGTTKLSGTAGADDLPFSLALPSGPNVITWKTDTGISRSGWSFELRWAEESATLQVPPTQQLGYGIEVVSVYKHHAGNHSVFAAVDDFAQPLSPQDQEVVSATPIQSSLQDQLLSLQATNKGEDENQTSKAMEFWLRSPHQEAKEAAERLTTKVWEAEDRSFPKGDWLQCSITLPGLIAEDFAKQGELRKALEKQLMTILDADVEIELRRVSFTILDATTRAAWRSPGPELPLTEGQPTEKATVVDFEVRSKTDLRALDHAEAKLLILGNSQILAANFDKQLLTTLRAAGMDSHKLPQSIRALLGEPKLMEQRRQSTAATPTAATSSAAAATFPAATSSRQNYQGRNLRGLIDGNSKDLLI